MRRLWIGVLGLALFVPVLWAGSEQLGSKASTTVQPKSSSAQFRELAQAYRTQMDDLGKQFSAAKSDEEKSKIRDKALKDTPAEYSEKMLTLAKADTKDPAAVDALVWICTQGAQAPQVPQAVDILLRDHAASERLGIVSRALASASRDDGPQLLRAIRTKATNKLVQLHAAFCLADALNEKDEPTAEQTKEAETLLADFLEKTKDLDTIPHDMIKSAENLLWEVRNLRTGKTAPDAESEDLAGKAAKLSDHKGKVVVLDFWATWCPPCRGMIPHEREMVKKHAGKKFVFISVSADEKKDTLKEFMTTEPMPWVHWWCGGQGGVVEKWNIKAFPTLYLIDAKGVIRAKLVGGGPETEKKLEELVEKLVQEAG